MPSLFEEDFRIRNQARVEAANGAHYCLSPLRSYNFLPSSPQPRNTHGSCPQGTHSSCFPSLHPYMGHLDPLCLFLISHKDLGGIIYPFGPSPGKTPLLQTQNSGILSSPGTLLQKLSHKLPDCCLHTACTWL